MGVLNVDPGQIRKGHKTEGTIEPPVPAAPQPVPPSDLSKFEQGFQLFNQLRDGSLTHGSRAVESRRWYKAIQLMASEDYELMEKLVNNPWLIRCALKEWIPCEDGIRWVKKEQSSTC
ncbi:hypothetical protein [Paenibacillus taichungensis]|uniref:hypothetical protein n=1 Tax=Paenibacillus taichungensis TaxID=484184 RepID=UPI0035E06681